MLSAKKNSVVGLDIEADSIAATEVQVNGTAEVARTAIGDLAPGAYGDGEVLDPELLARGIRSFFSEHNLAKNVRLGVANQRVSIRAMRLPLIEDPDELETAVRFQAQDELPMPLDEAVLDYQVIRKHTNENGERQMDLVAVAARRDMVAALADALGRAGLRPVGIDLSAFAMIRALAGEAAGDDQQTTLYCHLGDAMNLAVATGTACHFARTSQFGIETISQKLAERRGISLDEARRRLYVIGLEGEAAAEKGADETAVRETLRDGAGKLAAELRLSLDFYAAREDVPAIDRIAVCGPGSTILGLSDQLERTLGYTVDEERPRALSALDDRLAARLTVSYGLALEEAPV